MAVLRWTAQVVTWASTLFVVRFLSPADYGIAGLAMTVVAIAGVVAEFGLGTAVITFGELSLKQLAQFHALALMVAAGMGILLLVSATPAAAMLREPALAKALPALSLLFVADGLRVVPVAVRLRRLDYRMAGMVDLLKSIVAAGVALALAAVGWGYWALILAALGSSAAATGWLAWRQPQSMAWPRSHDLADPLRHAWHIVVGRLAWMVYRSSDFLVVGRMLGSTSLGFYTAGWNLASLPGEKLGNVVTAVTAPLFGAIQHDRAVLRHYFLFVTRLLSLVLTPALVGILLVSDLAVPLILGQRWAPAIPILRLLCLYALMQSILIPVGQIFNVTRRTRFAMWVGIAALVVFPPAFYVGARAGGIAGVAWSWVLVYPFFASLMMAVAMRDLGVGARRLLTAAAPALVCSTIMSVAVVGARRLWPGTETGAVLLFTLCGLGAAVYLAALWFAFPAAVLEVRRTMVQSQVSPEPSPV